MDEKRQLVKLIIPDSETPETIWTYQNPDGSYELTNVPLSPYYCRGDVVAAYKGVITGTLQKVADWDNVRLEADKMWEAEWQILNEDLDHYFKSRKPKTDNP